MMTLAQVKAELEANPNMGAINLEKSGNCASFNWHIKWQSRTGDLPALTVSEINSYNNI